MKKLMIVLLMSVTIFGCKDKENKNDTVKDPNIDQANMEIKNDNDAILQLGCYEYITDGDNVKMEITRIDGNDVTANLLYAYAEKDKNDGTFSGKINDDKLIGTYTFMSEGKQSIRDVAFKVEKDQIVEGFGDLDEAGTKFIDKDKLNYNATTPWKKVDCN